MYDVAILMSTYNGEKYIREQIESILRQERVNIYLYIRDDGSSDNTVNILSEYAYNYNNIFFESGRNKGVGNSFFELLYSVDNCFDYYALSDQDDIWEPKKIFEAIECMTESNSILYGSNQECVDKYGNSLGLRYESNYTIDVNPVSVMVVNKIAGCTMLFGQKLYRILVNKRPSEEILRVRIHDVWIAMVASLHGEVYYDNRSFMKYRQHENNVYGAYEKPKIIEIFRKIKKIFNKNQQNGRSIFAREISNIFKDEVFDYPIIIASATYNKIDSRLYLIKNRKIQTQYSGETEFGFVLKILLGVY